MAIRKGRVSMTLKNPPVASFPRTLGPADPVVVSPRAVAPLVNVYDPPIQPSKPFAPALPASGVSGDIEARTVDVPWPSSNGILTVSEVSVYATTGQWRALDVFIEDLDEIEADQVLTVRVYSVSAAGPATLVASGRFTQGGDFFPAAAVGGPQWVCAARAQAERFLVTFQVGAFGNAPLVATQSGQTAKITIVASNRSDSPPPNLGAIPISPSLHNSAAAALETFSRYNAELLMVQGVADPAAAAPRFLHVHNRANAAAVPGAAPLFSFPLGLGTAPTVCTHWFPGGLRTYGNRGWQLAVSSTQFTTTLAAGGVNGLFR